MRRSNWLVMGSVVTLALAVVAGAWAEQLPKREWIPRGQPAPGVPIITVVAGDTIWVNAHDYNACPGSTTRGGELTGGGYSPKEVWCFEGGSGDSVSTAGGRTYVFNSFDKRQMRDSDDSLYWHADDFQAIAGKSMWCGGTNNRCASWQKTMGYGTEWEQLMQLDLTGPYNLARGCSLQFRTHYVQECLYDYGYLELYSFKRSKWYLVDAFNGKSGCTATVKPCIGDWNNSRPHTACPTAGAYGDILNYPSSFDTRVLKDSTGYPYVSSGSEPANNWVLLIGDTISNTPTSTGVRLRWRFQSDGGVSTEDGNAQVHGWWVDDIVARANGATIFTYDFNTLANGALPPNPPWTFPKLEGVYDGWAIRYDLDPPLEGYFLPSPGDSGIPSSCQINASWQWSITPSNTLIPPPADPKQPIPGYYVMLTTPRIPLNYTDSDSHQGGPPFAQPAVYVQFDDFQNMLPETNDFTEQETRIHQTSGDGPWAPTGAWCAWQNPRGFIYYGGGTFWAINDGENVGALTSVAGVDSVQYAWASMDWSFPGDSSWDPNLPPHTGTQYVVDNVSIAIVDGSGTVFTAIARQDQFQDTFNTHTCMHTANVANADLGYGRYKLHDKSESLAYGIVDPNGLSATNAKINYSINGASFIAKNMNLSVPRSDGNGGQFRTTLCDTPWTPGSQIRWYLTAQDNLGNIAYLPRGASPDSTPRTFYTVNVLPTAGAKILLVDDFGGRTRDYSPCRQDTVVRNEDLFYKDVLKTLGYQFMTSGGYDEYTVQSASSNQNINEPWGFWKQSGSTPDSGFRTYDVVIYGTGWGAGVGTIQDTTQEYMEQFVFHGGKALICGDAIGTDIATFRRPPWPDFYDKLLGAQYIDQMASPLRIADYIPRVPTPMIAPPGGILASGDSMHIYTACNAMRTPLDKITLSDTTNWPTPRWAHPKPYLLYKDTTAPYDSVAGIYVNVDKIPGQNGQVVYLPWSLSALVDAYKITCDPPASSPPGQDVGLGKWQGRAEVLTDILGIFGQPVPATSVAGQAGGHFVNSLSPAQPNPFNPKTTIKFSLSRDAQMSLTVFDVTGRKVKTLVNDVQAAGPHEVLWTGQNDSGRQVASGLYFARMETKGFIATEKLTLLK